MKTLNILGFSLMLLFGACTSDHKSNNVMLNKEESKTFKADADFLLKYTDGFILGNGN